MTESFGGPEGEPVFSHREVDFSPWSESKNEYRETLPDKEIAFAFIKPGSEDDFQGIIDVIREEGLELIYAERLRLAEEAVDYFYRDAMEKPHYPAMKEYLLNNDVTMLMVGGKGHDAQELLSGLKKTKDGQDGILRTRFKKDDQLTREDLDQWKSQAHQDQDNVTVKLTQQNVIHTADSTEEAVESLRILLGDKFNSMRIRGMLPSELWDFFRTPKSQNDASNQDNSGND